MFFSDPPAFLDLNGSHSPTSQNSTSIPSDPNQPRQGFFGSMGQKVSEADQFVRSLQPENAQALLVAGLSLLDNQSAGKAGLNALQFRQGVVQNSQRNELRQQQIDNQRTNQEALQGLRQGQQQISRANLAISARNSDTARMNASLARERFDNPAPAKPDAFERNLQSLVASGTLTEDEANEKRLERANTQASGTRRNVNVDGKPITPQREQDIRTHISSLDRNIGDLQQIIDLSAEDPSLLGVGGSARKAGQTIFGIAKDASGALPEVFTNFLEGVGQRVASDVNSGDLDERTFGELFSDPNISDIRKLENNFAYAIARARQPTGRLLADTLRLAREDAKLTGLASSTDVINRVKSILGDLQSQRDSLQTDLNDLAPSRSHSDIKPGTRRRYVPGQGFVEIE